MTMVRFKADPESPEGFYHCSSRVAFKSFIFNDTERDEFVRLMRLYEVFCHVHVVTFCCMSNHTHLVVRVPRRPDPGHLPSDRKLVSLVRMVSGKLVAGSFDQQLKRLREDALASSDRGQNPNPQAHVRANREIEALRETVLCRMWDVSWFMRLVKQRFSSWYNRTHNNSGTIWSARFHSVLVESSGRALAAMGAYVDLNPVRARMSRIPEDYRWSGYGAAIRGDRVALAGIEILASALENVWGGNTRLTGRKALESYRTSLYDNARERKAAFTPDGFQPARAGIPDAVVDKVVAARGRLSLAQAMLFEIRYFTHGLAFGSRAFVESVFQRYRRCFGVKRTSGARPLRGIEAQGLYCMRDLRKGVIEKPDAAAN